MKSTPPDWNNDRKLWEVLGRLRSSAPPSNFAYCVRQKLAQTPSPRRNAIFSWQVLREWLDSIKSLRRWTWGMAGAVACLLFAVVIFEFRMPSKAPENQMIYANEETSQLVQHYELLQDFEVIEHLDELM